MKKHEKADIPLLLSEQQGCEIVLVARSSTFTLIELLVVIAIIGILMTMLLPSLNKAKGMAQRTYCGNNLNQQSKSLNMYYNDYATYPVMYLDASNYKTSFRRLMDAGYFKERIDEFTIDPILQCPTDRVDRNNGWARRSYGENGCDTVTAGYDGSKYYQLKNIPEPSKTISFTEAHNYESRSFTGGRILWDYTVRCVVNNVYNTGMAADAAENRSLDIHGKNKQNYLFFDGHVKAVNFWETLKPGFKTSDSLANWGYTSCGERNMWVLNGENEP